MAFRILMVLDHPFPEDARVHNEARSLLGAGYEVTLLSISPDRDRPRREDVGGIEVVRTYVPKKLRGVLRGIAGQVPGYSALIAAAIAAEHRRQGFNLIHAHDLYTVGGALLAGKPLGGPVIADLHENVVHALGVYAWSTRPPGSLVVDLDKWAESEHRWLNEVDRVIVVIEEAKDRVRELGVDDERIVVVPNTIALEVFDTYPTEDALIERFADDVVLTYTGYFNLHRGLAPVIDALPKVLAHEPRARLLLVGEGSIEPELREQAERLGVADRVTFEGFQPQARLKSYILASDVTLVPHLKSVHTDATIPHKLFHYMYFARPVVVTDCRPLQRIVDETGAGLVVTSGDSEAMADAIISLIDDPARRALMGASGQAAVKERYHWDATTQAMIKMVDELASAHAPAPRPSLHDDPVEARRFENTLRFMNKSAHRPRKVLDLGPPNRFGDVLTAHGYEVSNTEGDLDDDPAIVAGHGVDAVCAFEILEHLVGPLEVLRHIDAPRLFVSVPLKLWFADAYYNANDPLDCHYHEFEPWQLDRLLDKAGWRIVRRERWRSPPTRTLGWRPLLRRLTDRYYAVEAVRAD